MNETIVCKSRKKLRASRKTGFGQDNPCMKATYAYAIVVAVLFLLAVSGGAARGDEMNFQHHFVDRQLPGSQWGQTALVDIDRDGDLDFVTGRTNGDIRWYEFVREDKTWTLHLLGRDSPSDVGGLAIDVDRDGRVDFVSGGAWYQQPQDPKSEPWRGMFSIRDPRRCTTS